MSAQPIRSFLGAERIALPRTELGRAALLLAVVVVAFLRPIQETLRADPAPAALAAIAVPLVLALALSASIQLRRRPEQPIHDRDVDVIVAVTALGLAGLPSWLVAARLDALTWALRLDLLGLAPFVAGAAAVLVGTRAMWRHRWPLLVLGSIPLFQAALYAFGPAGLAAASLVSGTAVGWACVRRAPSPPGWRPPPRAVARLGPSVLVLLVGIGGTWAFLGDLSWPTDDRSDATLRAGALPPPPRMTVTGREEHDDLAHDLAGPGATWTRTVLRGPYQADLPRPPRMLSVDVIRTRRLGALAGLPVGALLRLSGVESAGGRTYALPHGVTATTSTWSDDVRRLTFTVLEMTLRSPGGESARVVLSCSDDPSLASPLPRPGLALGHALRVGLSNVVRGTPNEQTGGSIGTAKHSAWLLSNARAIVRAAT